MNFDPRLYLCTDRGLLAGRGLVEALEAAVAGGVTLVQLREKEAPTRQFYEIGREVRAATTRLGVPLIVNDRADIALAIGADGLHVGQSDLPVAQARRIMGAGAIIGCSAKTVEQAGEAVAAGADYIGTGPVFTTDTKLDAGNAVGLARLAEVAAAVDVPVVGIGGIDQANAAQVLRAGAAGASVISAILGAEDIEQAARAVREAVEDGLRARTD
ncbi:MAG: thiamine phosphate synthase [Propionibacteriaceae bacterium]|jgi:thiamine-phosphate diphosphorylase|nr:thiamine phosphate synthase [Propionibacteriaceae bacterium]